MFSWTYSRLSLCLGIVMVLVCAFVQDVQARALPHKAEINIFYQHRDGTPVWISEGALNDAGHALLRHLGAAWTHGLNPEKYHLAQIRDLMAHTGSDQSILELEVLLTSAYIAYVRDLSGMRVDAAALDLRMKDWRQKITPNQALSYLAVPMVDMDIFLGERSPQTRTYREARNALIALVEQDAQGQRGKIEQLIVNLERLRWVPDEKPERFVVVNIPSASLWAIEGGDVVLQMPVVIGRTDRQTLSFVTEITGVRFNPTWTVPTTIKNNDIVPRLIENPYYLAGKGMELYSGYGEGAVTLDPAVIDWDMMSRAQIDALRFVQGAGRNNPLGRIRVLMPNPYNIYLHDTNEAWLRGRDVRATSSGCVRVKKPVALAAFILKQQGEDVEKAVDKFLKNTDTRDVFIKNPIPVYLLYYTIWLGDKSRITYGKDVYGIDKNVLQALQKLDEFPDLDNNNVINTLSVD